MGRHKQKKERKKLTEHRYFRSEAHRYGPGHFMYDMFMVYLERQVGRSAAALSYYLIFTFFPVLMMINAFLGYLHLDTSHYFAYIEDALPTAVVNIVSTYLKYVSYSASPTVMLIAGLGMLLVTASAAFRVIMNTNRDICRITDVNTLVHTVVSFIMPIITVLVIYLALGVLLTGRWFFQLFRKYLHVDLELFNLGWVRFVILFGLLFLFLWVLYYTCLPRQAKNERVFPGALISASLLVAVTIIFARLIGMSTRYSVIYGSLASIMVMLFWLYLCCNVIFIGNMFNYVLYCYRKAKKTGQDPGKL